MAVFFDVLIVIFADFTTPLSVSRCHNMEICVMYVKILIVIKHRTTSCTITCIVRVKRKLNDV